MPAKKDLSNQTFGRLTAIKDVGKRHGSRLWECRCSCGNTHYVTASALGFGMVQSCGCTHHDPKGKHNHARAGKESRTYMIWKAMIQRCHNPNSSAYRYYGARGITVCDRWRNSFTDFLSDMGEKPEAMSLDRADNDGPYSHDNCRWVSTQMQARNKRNTRMITALGKTLTMSEWARELNISLQTISYTINQAKKDATYAIEYHAKKNRHQ